MGSSEKVVAGVTPHRDPTDIRIMAKHIYEFLTLGPGAIRHGRGVEKPNRTEKLKIVARERSTRRTL
jgi:hypothetical protein